MSKPKQILEENTELDFIEVESETHTEESIFLDADENTEAAEGFLPDVSEAELEETLTATAEEVAVELEGTELDSFESAPIEEVQFVEDEQLESIVESVLFASDRPVSLASLKLVFKETNIKGDRLRKTLDRLAVEYAGSRRGVTLEEVPGGFQLRTKIDNLEFLRGNLKARVFKLSGPALEVLSITAYKQPVVKAEIDQIRGVESGHLLRALMEKGLVNFEGKSELPGRPMQYGTTKKFLEIFGLRNLKELPTLSQIDELLPDGIGEEEVVQKPKLSDITETLAASVGGTYSDGEEELEKIQSQLSEISTSSEFFEIEKQKQKEKKDLEKAQNIREGLALGETVSNRDINWLKKYDEALMTGNIQHFEKEESIPVALAIASEAGSESLEFEDSHEEDEPHIEDEIPFHNEADDIDGESEASI